MVPSSGSMTQRMPLVPGAVGALLAEDAVVGPGRQQRVDDQAARRPGRSRSPCRCRSTWCSPTSARGRARRAAGPRPGARPARPARRGPAGSGVVMAPSWPLVRWRRATGPRRLRPPRRSRGLVRRDPRPLGRRGCRGAPGRSAPGATRAATTPTSTPIELTRVRGAEAGRRRGGARPDQPREPRPPRRRGRQHARAAGPAGRAHPRGPPRRRGVVRPDRGVLRQPLREPPRPPRRGLRGARRLRTGGVEPALLPRRGSAAPGAARSTSRERSNPTPGRTSAPRSTARSRRCAATAARSATTSSWSARSCAGGRRPRAPRPAWPTPSRSACSGSDGRHRRTGRTGGAGPLRCRRNTTEGVAVNARGTGTRYLAGCRGGRRVGDRGGGLQLGFEVERRRHAHGRRRRRGPTTAPPRPTSRRRPPPLAAGQPAGLGRLLRLPLGQAARRSSPTPQWTANQHQIADGPQDGAAGVQGRQGRHRDGAQRDPDVGRGPGRRARLERRRAGRAPPTPSWSTWVVEDGLWVTNDCPAASELAGG